MKNTVIALALMSAAFTAQAKVNTWVLGHDTALGNKCDTHHVVKDKRLFNKWVSKNDKTVQRLTSTQQASTWQRATKEANTLRQASALELMVACQAAYERAQEDKTEFNQLPPMQQY